VGSGAARGRELNASGRVTARYRPHMEAMAALWRALDDRFAHVEPQPWGAVVTDERFPDVWDVNYARVERMLPSLTLEEVESTLEPALERVGAAHRHLVLFDPDAMAPILVAASSRGAFVSWDAVMSAEPAGIRPPPDEGPVAREVDGIDDAFLDVVRSSMSEFDVRDEGVERQLLSIERLVLLPAGKRWFLIEADGRTAALGSLLPLGDVALVDHIVTFPFARRRGLAEVMMRSIAHAAAAEEIASLVLLAEPGGRAEALYDRIGYRRARTIASLRERRDAARPDAGGAPAS
jgi:ribosomal protein S18 acetylase RimI-like enzyme